MTATRPFPNLGTQQSPIDLGSPTGDFLFQAESVRAEVLWTTLTLKAKAQPPYAPTRKLAASGDGVLRLDGQNHVPVDLHWHFPCEHHADGRTWPSEAHIVHVHEDDVPWALQGKLDWCRIAVIGVFLEEGDTPYEPMSVATTLPEGAETGPPIPVAKDAILPPDARVRRYAGSLTTPPYSENVTFLICEQAMTATAAQLADGGLPNARALQDRNRRCCVVGALH